MKEYRLHLEKQTQIRPPIQGTWVPRNASTNSGAKTLPALSIKQPWSWLITNNTVFPKNYENRTRRWNYKGPLLIHAGQTPDNNWSNIVQYLAADTEEKRDAGHPVIKVPLNAPCGGFVGIATVKGCLYIDDVDISSIGSASMFWFQGPFGYELAEARPFTKLIPYSGAQGIFYVPLVGPLADEIKAHKEYHGLIQ